MNFKTVEEMKATVKEYGNNFSVQLAENVTVHQDYMIDGLSEQNFCNGYKEYQAVARLMQSDIYEHPEKFGLIAYDKK